MKTHIPASLRKALLAALFATATYSAHAVVDITNKSTGFAETTLGSDKTSTGYTDLTFSGTNSVLGTVNHWCHDYNNIGIPDYYNDRQGDSTEITLTPDERTGKYIAHSITSNRGKDTDTNLNAEKLHNHGSTGEFGYSYSWSNGNINVTNAAVLEVTTSIRANGTTKIEGSSRVTAGNEVTAGDIKVSSSSLTTGNITVSQNELWVPGEASIKSSGVLSVSGSNTNVTATGAVSAVGAVNVSNGADLNAGKVAAGEISVNGASLTAGDITVTKNELWVAGGDSVESSGELRLSGSNTNVTATGVVSAVGGVDVSNSAHLNASTITSKVTGSKGYVRALPGENLKVALVASEGTQYIVDNGCTITLGGIGVYDEENKVMHGNGNYFGYGEDSNNIKADAIYVMGNIISDDNELVALGGNVDNRLEDSSYSAILVQGSITGNGNKLFVREQDSAGIWVTKGVSGDNNVLETKTSGDIHIAGTLGRSKDSDDGAAKGNTIAAGDDVTIHQLDDNENLIIDALNGEVAVEVASEATLINSTITADGSITFASDASQSTKELTLVGGSVESDTGDIVSNQVIRANGTALTAEEGDINVYRLTYDQANTENTGIQVTAQNLISEEDLTLDGTKTGSFDSFVTVTEDMRTTKGSIIINNFTDQDTVKVGHDIDSANSIIVKNVNGMLVGTEGEDGIEYEGSMTAKKDIKITDSIVDILGDQEATDGNISIIKDGSDTRVTIDGDQIAGTTNNVKGATLRVGILVEEEGADGKPVYSVEGGKQVAGSSINIAAASIVEVLDSQEAKDAITITGSTVTVGAKNTDGEIVQKGNQTAGARISIEDSTVTVLGSETARMDITVTDSAVNVGGSQTSTEGSIVIQSTEKQGAAPSEVTVAGDQLAAERIKVADGSTLTVGTLDTDAKTGVVTLSGGNQQADGEEGININAATANVLGNQTATLGAIDIKHGSRVTVGSLNEKGEVLGGKQTANTDIMVTDDSQLSVLGDQTANQNITIVDSMVTVLGDQKATAGYIDISSTPGTGITSEVSVGGNQEAGTYISVANSQLTVGTKDEDGNVVSRGDQWAAKQIKIVAGSDVEVIGDQTALDEDIIVAKGSTLTVGAIQEHQPLFPGMPSSYELIGGNQEAGRNIVVAKNGKADVLGDQTAGGSIIVKGSTLSVGAKADDGKVVHAGNQTANEDIAIVKGSAVTVLGNETAGGDIVVKDSTLKVGDLEHVAGMPMPPFDWLHGGDQTANGNISISNSTVEVLRNQKAETGAITIQKGSDVTIGSKDSAGRVLGGNQTAQTDINIANSTVHVLGDEEAVTGEIVIAKTDLDGADTIVNVGGDQTAQTNIIVKDANLTVEGDQTATEGYIDISSTLGTGITSEVSVGGNQEAGTYISVANSLLTVGTAETVTDEATGEEHVVLTGGNQTADTGDIVVSTSTVEVLADQTATEGGIKIDKLSLVAVGTLDADGKVLAGDQLAKQDIAVDSSTLTVLGDQTSQEGNINVQALEDYSVVMVGGNQKAKQNISVMGSKEFDAPTTVLVGEDQIAEEGNIAINDAQVSVNGKVVALGNGNDGTGIVALAGATYSVGTSLEAKELNIGTIDNPSEVTINVGSLDADGNPLDTVLDVDKLTVAEGNTLHTGNVKMDAVDVSIAGAVEVGVKDEDPEKAVAANWETVGTHLISGEGASLKANGNISIAAAAEGDTIRIADGATVAATGNVTIQGLAASLAEVDGAIVRAKGDITFDNAELKNNHDTGVTTKGGNIVLKNRVEISDTILNVTAPEGVEPGVIDVTEGADVQLYQGTVDVFNGKLAGKGSVTANDENLTLYHDATAFNGTINLVRDNEQALNIACEGVGEEAVINLTEGSSLYTIVGGQGAHLGNVVTTDRSHIQLTAVEKGNTATATSLNLTEGTTYDVLATTDENGAMVSDNITVSGSVLANGARVAAHTTGDMETVADGTRFTIVTGNVDSAFNEDVAYDMLRDAHGVSSLRKLQTRNLHLEHTAQGVDLVVSENYKGINTNNANVNAVREVIMPLDAAADHRPGKLAESTSNLDHILDALDYTRSGADAKAGLLSVSAATNLIVPNMMMDASRHHLSTLRDHMAMPVCTEDFKGKGNVWASYTGGHDFIGGDDNLGKYSHSYQGAIVGGDYAVNCNWAVGLSVGYQKSIARAEATRADADVFSGDLYVAGRTGKFEHRFSMGVSSYSTDVKRGTRIAAKGHTYDALSTGSADGMSWNFGYQLSRSYALNEVSSLTPYLTVDVALQRIDTMTEKGQGDASVVTDYEDFVQTDAALGVSYSHTFTSFNQQTGVFAFDLAVHGEFSEHRATAKNHFVDSPADTWKTRSAKRAPLYGELGGHVVVPFTQRFSGTAGVNFEFSDDRTYIGGHAGVNYRF